MRFVQLVEVMTTKKVNKLLIGLLTLVFMLAGCQAKETPPFLEVAGVPVSQRVYQYFLQNEKASTVSHYMTKYHTTYNEHFWLTKYGSEIPQQFAQDKALRTLKQYIVEDKALVTAGLIKKPLVAFTDLKKADQTGASLSGMAAAQKTHSALMMRLRSQYAKKYRQTITSKQLENFYSQNKDKYWGKPNLVNYQALTFEREKINDLGRFTALVQQVSGKSSDLSTIQNDFASKGFSGTFVMADSSHDKDKYYGNYLRASNSGDVQQGIIFIAWTSNETMSLVRPITFTNGGYYDFSTVKEDVAVKLLERRLNATLAKKAARAVLQVNKAALSKQKLS